MLVNEYTVNRKLVRQWLFENMTEGRKFKFLLLWSCLAVLSAVGMVLSGFSPFYIFALLYCVYMAILRDLIFAGKQYADSKKANGGPEWMRTVTINEEEIVIREPSVEVKYLVADVSRVTEKGDKIRLIFKNGKAVRMYLSAFTKGNWETGKRILEHTEKESGIQ